MLGTSPERKPVDTSNNRLHLSAVWNVIHNLPECDSTQWNSGRAAMNQLPLQFFSKETIDFLFKRQPDTAYRAAAVHAALYSVKACVGQQEGWRSYPWACLSL